MIRKNIVKIGLVVVVVLLLIGFFYWRGLRGLRPALFKPSQNIADIIDQANEAKPSPAEATEPADQSDKTPAKKSAVINDTGFPLQLHPDFSISIFARDIGQPRVLLRDPAGTMVTSLTRQGQVIALPDADQDGKADRTVVVASDLNQPHGLAFKCDGGNCKLYIAETNQLAVYDYDQASLKATNKKKLVDLPNDGGHFTRSLIFRPKPNDNQLLVSIGSKCNVCHEADKRRAAIWVYDTNDGSFESFATGLRNAVFLTRHPQTQEVWVTEMGRDWLGDDLPPDEINIIKEGGNYGWPICYGKNIHDTNFDKNTYVRAPCSLPFEQPSVIDIQAHSAPLGLAFFSGSGWPQEFQNNLLVAFHGSWNRTTPTGYKVRRYQFVNNEVIESDFIDGWLQKGNALGRPADIMIEANGKMYVSDDKAGVIYLLTHKSAL